MNRIATVVFVVDLIIGATAFFMNGAVFKMWLGFNICLIVLGYFIYIIVDAAVDAWNNPNSGSSTNTRNHDLDMAKINVEHTYNEIRRCRADLLMAEEYSANYYALERRIDKLEIKLRDYKAKVRQLS